MRKVFYNPRCLQNSKPVYVMRLSFSFEISLTPFRAQGKHWPQWQVVAKGG